MAALTYPCFMATNKGWNLGDYFFFVSSGNWYNRSGICPNGKVDYWPAGLFLTDDGSAQRLLMHTDKNIAYSATAQGAYWTPIFTTTSATRLMRMWYGSEVSKLIGVGFTGNVYNIHNPWRGLMTHTGSVPYDTTGWKPVFPGGPDSRHDDYCMDHKGRLHAVHRDMDSRKTTEYCYSDDYGVTWSDEVTLQSATGEGVSAWGLLQNCVSSEQTIECFGDSVHIILGLSYIKEWFVIPEGHPNPSGPVNWDDDLSPFYYDKFSEGCYCIRHIYSYDRGETWNEQDLYLATAFKHWVFWAYVALGYWQAEEVSYEGGETPSYTGSIGVLFSVNANRVAMCVTDDWILVTNFLGDQKIYVWKITDPENSPAFSMTNPAGTVTSSAGPSLRNWIGGNASVTGSSGSLYPHEATKIYTYYSSGAGNIYNYSNYFPAFFPYSIRWDRTKLEPPPPDLERNSYNFWW